MVKEMAGITKLTGKMVDELRVPKPEFILDNRVHEKSASKNWRNFGHIVCQED